MRNKNLLVGVVVFLLIIGAVFVIGRSQTSQAPTVDQNDTIKEESGSENGANMIEGEIKEFTMTARQFEFVPAEIRVNEGDTVVLNITSEDVPHGIAIPEFGVNANLPVGSEERVEFVADKKGEFTMFCSVFCGSGHRDMTATLIVE